MAPSAEGKESTAAEAGSYGKEKPALYFVFHARRADKHRQKRERKLAKKLAQQKERKADQDSNDEDDGHDGSDGRCDKEAAAEASEARAPDDGVAVVSKAKKKRKAAAGTAGGAATTGSTPGLQDQSQEGADDTANAKEEAQARKRRRKAAPTEEKEGDAGGEGQEVEQQAPQEEVQDSEATKETGPSVTEMEKTFHPPGFFSDMRFEDLVICEPLKRALKEHKFETLTEIQAKSVPHLLNGKDVLGAAKTGSGKTLAFLVPAIDMLYNIKFIPRNGVGALIISPTRELAMQIYDVLRNVAVYVSQSWAVCVGGMNRRPEAEKLGKGVNILVATPGRLLDHMQNTKGFVYHNLVSLTVDEADRILEVGFEEEMNMILKLLPKKRQTALFSATQTRKVADLARMSLSKPVFVEVKTQDNVATVSGLTQGYVVVPAQNRFLLLFTFLKKNKDKKVMVFFSSCNSVRFHDELLNYIDIPVQCIHGHKKQTSRSSTYYNFCSADKGILLCTDVAARGLDIPRVDWIVQYDPPDEPKEYIHRVGRTARGAEGTGKALLFLMPEELGFLQYLRRAGVPVSEYTFPTNKIANIQTQLERVLDKNYHLHRSSRDAYRAYMHAYAAHSHKDCFDVHSLDLQQVAKCFGFSAPPRVDLNLKHAPRKAGPKDKKAAMATGHTFSASNPYGKREANDKRQFAR